MNNEQKKIVATIEKIGKMVLERKMPLELIPISDIKIAMECALCHDEESDLEKQIVELFGEILTQQSMEYNTEGCYNIINLIALTMQSAYKKSDYYAERAAIAVKQMMASVEENNAIYEDIITHYKNNQIDEQFINERSYSSLVAVKKNGTVQLFKDISKCVHEVALNQIRKKDKWKIVFLLKDSAEWSCEELYQKFYELPNIDVEIVVTPFLEGTQKVINDTYLSTIEYFGKKGCKVTGIFNVHQNRYMSWKEIGMPDFVFHLNPHHRSLGGTSNICEFPLRILNVYIPYGIMTYGNVDHQYNQMSHMLFWKIFCESDMHRMMAEKYSDIGDFNVIYSGYTKMDSFFKTISSDVQDIWKISKSADAKQVKKIIYAPHWSVKNAFTGFGNFDKTYKELYEYAKNNEETTSWIIRPHPMLRAGVVMQGVFANEEEFDAYLQMWEDLPNAKVSLGGTCVDIFKTSDTMILDSVSFLSEYLYVHKPMLFLTRERQTFNDFGRQLVEVLYKVDGGDFDKIVEYIDDIVMKNNDYMKPERENFYRKYLNYVEENGRLASEFICDYIVNEIM